MDGEEILDQVSLAEAEPELERERTLPMRNEQSKDILITDPAWSDYVMTHFAEDELFDGNPTCNGLRRVAELLLGTIIESKSQVVSTPDLENEFSTVVSHTVKFDGLDVVKEFTAVADCTRQNTDPRFAIYPTAVAATRAEAIALKKALKLKRLAAEEISNMPVPVNSDSSEFIPKSQIVFLSMLGERTNANLKRILLDKCKCKSIKEVSYKIAEDLGKYLNKVQRNEEQLTKKYIGFDSNWSKGD